MASLVPKRNLHIDQGSTFYIEFQYMKKSEGSTEENIIWEPYDLTGLSVRMQIRETLKSPTPLVDLTANDYIRISDPENGIIEIEIPAYRTETISVTAAVYDVELVWPAEGEEPERVRRLVEGTVSVSPEVTRPEGV